MINKSLALFKKKFQYLIPIDISFFILLFIFLNYSRSKIQGYMQTIQQYSPQLINIQNLLQQSTSIENLQQADLLLNSINLLVKRALLFGYFIMPIAIFLLWVVFQGLSYKSILKEKFSFDYKFFIKFFLVTLPFFILLTLVLFYILSTFTNIIPYYGGTFSGDYLVYPLLLVLIISFYLLIIIYSKLDETKLINSVKKGFSTSIKKFYYLFPLYLGYLSIIVLFIIFFLNNFVFYIGNFNAFSAFNLIITIVLLVVLVYYRLLFALSSRSS